MLAGGLFDPEHARQMHLGQAKSLEGKLANAFDGSTVVITHFLPHPLSIRRKYEGRAPDSRANREQSKAFANGRHPCLADVIARQVAPHSIAVRVILKQ